MAYTYTTLTSDVLANMEEDSDEFVSALPSIISRAQEYLQRRIDSAQITRRQTVSVSASNRELSLPSDLLILKSVRVCVSGGWANLIQQTDEYLTAYWPDFTSVGEPTYYAPVDNTLIYLAPTPTSNASANLEYVARVTVLTSAAPTNWFSENTENAFFAAAMMYANMWTKNSEAVAVWKSTVDEELAVINNEARRQRRSDTIDRSNGAPENTLSGNA